MVPQTQKDRTNIVKESKKGMGVDMVSIKTGESYTCPVCSKYTFEAAGDYDVCPICGWEDDIVQLDNPDEEDCANHMSLNQARRAYERGFIQLIKDNEPYPEREDANG